MNKRYVPIVTLSLAILLVGSIVYASDKKKKAKVLVPEPNEISEEALKAELLTTPEDQHKKQPVSKVSSLPKNDSVDLAELKIK